MVKNSMFDILNDMHSYIDNPKGLEYNNRFFVLITERYFPEGQSIKHQILIKS